MKKLRLIILLSFFTLAMHAQTSQPRLQQKLSISVKEMSLEEVLKKLEKEMGGVVFAYSPSTFDVAQPVTIEAKEKPLIEILDEVFKGKLEVKEMRDKIFLMKKKKSASGQQSQAAENKTQRLKSLSKIPRRKDTLIVEAKEPESLRVEKTQKAISETTEKSEVKNLTQEEQHPVSNANSQAEEITPLPKPIDADTINPSIRLPIEEKRLTLIKASRPQQEVIYPHNRSLPVKPELARISVDTSLIRDEASKGENDKTSKKKTKREKPPREPEEKKFRFYVAPTGSLTDIDRQLGVKVGGRLVYLKNTRFGFGLSGSALIGELVDDPVLSSRYRIAGGYGGVFLEYNLRPYSRVHLSFPVTLALGAITYMRQDATGLPVLDLIEDQRVLGFVEPGVMVEYNVWKYIKVGFEVNYRYTTFSELNYSGSGDVILSGSGLNGFSGGLTLKLGIF